MKELPDVLYGFVVTSIFVRIREESVSGDNGMVERSRENGLPVQNS